MLDLTPAQRADAETGMRWWNSIREYERALWLTRAGSSRPVDAWNLFKALRDAGREVSSLKR